MMIHPEIQGVLVRERLTAGDSDSQVIDFLVTIEDVRTGESATNRYRNGVRVLSSTRRSNGQIPDWTADPAPPTMGP